MEEENKKEKYFNFIWIKGTFSGHCSDLDRWECPKCKVKVPYTECRFNLSPKKRGTLHTCRFCKQKGWLKK